MGTLQATLAHLQIGRIAIGKRLPIGPGDVALLNAGGSSGWCLRWGRFGWLRLGWLYSFCRGRRLSDLFRLRWRSICGLLCFRLPWFLWLGWCLLCRSGRCWCWCWAGNGLIRCWRWRCRGNALTQRIDLLLDIRA